MGPPDLQSGAFATRRTHAERLADFKTHTHEISNLRSIRVKKRMKAERNKPTNTLRGTLLLRMANSRTLAKHRVHHPEGSLPSSLAKRYFDCQKTKGAGFKLPREAARSFKSLEFAFEIWERESAPAD